MAGKTVRSTTPVSDDGGHGSRSRGKKKESLKTGRARRTRKHVEPAVAGGVPQVLVLGLAAFVALHLLAVDVRHLLGMVAGGSFFARPKLIVMCGGLALAVFALVSLGRPRIADLTMQLRKNRVAATLLVAIVLFALSPLFATETPVRIGMLGFPFRYDGAFTLVASLVLVAAAARMSFLESKTVTAVLAAFVGAAVVIALMAIVQSLGGDVWAWLGVSGVDPIPPRATLGNPAFVSVVVASAVVMTLNASLVPWLRENAAGYGAALAALGVLAWATAAAGSRAGLAALVVVVAGWFVVLVVRPGGGRRLRSALAPLALVVLGLAGGYLSSDYGQGKIDRLAGVATGTVSDANLQARGLFVGIAGRAIAAQPVRPYGVGAFTIVSWEHASEEQTRSLLLMHVPPEAIDTTERVQNRLTYTLPGSDISESTTVIHDKVHNYVIDSWLAYGALPTLALLVLVGLITWRLVKARTWATMTVLMVVLVYAVFAQAWFPTVTLEPVVFTLLGVGWGSAERTLRGGSG